MKLPNDFVQVVGDDSLPEGPNGGRAFYSYDQLLRHHEFDEILQSIASLCSRITSSLPLPLFLHSSEQRIGINLGALELICEVFMGFDCEQFGFSITGFRFPFCFNFLFFPTINLTCKSSSFLMNRYCWKRRPKLMKTNFVMYLTYLFIITRRDIYTCDFSNMRPSSTYVIFLFFYVILKKKKKKSFLHVMNKLINWWTMFIYFV